MNMGNNEPYRISNEYNVSRILAHFDSNYIMHVIEDKLDNINYISSIIEPNFVGAFETNFKLMEQEFVGDSQNIRVIREEIYREIINILCNKFNLEFNTVDDTIDVFTAAYYLYDFLICNRNNILVDFFTKFIINNKDMIYNTLNINEYRKNRDSSTIYGKRVYADPKYAIISANIPLIINYISTLDIRLYNIFQSIYIEPKLVQFLDNAFADKGNFFKDHYCAAINNIEIQPVIITNIRLLLQRMVGDIKVSYIDEIITSSPRTDS